MKSFLQEIEDKFNEIEEQNLPGEDEINKSTAALEKYTAASEKYKEVAADLANVMGEEKEGTLCEMCGKVHEGSCGSHNEELDEMSTTAGVSGGQGPPKTPYAFAPSKRKMKNGKDKTYNTVQEAMDRKYERLIESYRQFSRGDKKMTPENKVKRTIQEVSKKLKEIEILVNHTNKLKTESGMSRDNYGPRTEKALNKISEKLIKIAERVRAIGE